MASMQGGTLIGNAILTNLLGRSEFGQFGMVQSTLLTLSGISQMGIGMMATKYIAEHRDSDPERAGRVLGLCNVISIGAALLASGLLAIASDWLAQNILHLPQLGPMLLIGTAYVFFSVVNSYQMGVLAGLEAYKSLAIHSLFPTALYLALCVILGWRWGAEGAVMALTVSMMARTAGFFIATQKESRRFGLIEDRRGGWQERALLWRFALPSALTGFLSMPALWLVNVFVARQPGGYAELALFAVALSLRNTILILPQIANNVVLSFLSNQLGRKNLGSYWRLFRLNFIITSVVLLVAGSCMALFGKVILKIFGASYVSGYNVLLILICAGFLEASSNAIYQIVQSSGQMWLSFLAVSVPRDGVLIISAYAMAPMGAKGAAIAYVVAALVSFLSVALAARRVRAVLA